MDLIIESQPFPCVDYFKNAIHCTNIKIDIYETFQKMSFRNRYMIYGANGIAALTIPIAGGREQKKLIKEVQIDFTEDWKTKHWRGIVSSYSKAPFFEYYRDEIEKLLFSKEKYLVDFNIKILIKLFKVLNINTSVIYTDAFFPTYESELDLRSRILPKNYQEKGNNWKPVYPQVFQERFGFQPNLSILDLLFNEGPNALSLLQPMD
jgi:hypothetical protein